MRLSTPHVLSSAPRTVAFLRDTLARHRKGDSVERVCPRMVYLCVYDCVPVCMYVCVCLCACVSWLELSVWVHVCTCVHVGSTSANFPGEETLVIACMIQTVSTGAEKITHEW